MYKLFEILLFILFTSIFRVFWVSLRHLCMYRICDHRANYTQVMCKAHVTVKLCEFSSRHFICIIEISFSMIFAKTLIEHIHVNTTFWIINHNPNESFRVKVYNPINVHHNDSKSCACRVNHSEYLGLAKKKKTKIEWVGCNAEQQGTSMSTIKTHGA